MGVPMLGDLCRRVVKANIDNVFYIPPELPFEEVTDILVLIKQADQLREIEKMSPHILKHVSSDDLWQALVEKDHGTRHKRFVRDYQAEYNNDPTINSWRKKYFEYEKADEIDKEIALAGLLASNQQRAETGPKTRIVSQGAVGQIRKPGFKSASTYSRGTRPGTIMQQVRKEAKEMARKRAIAKSSWAQASQTSNSQLGKVKVAPKGLQEEVRISKQPKFLPKTSKPPASSGAHERAKREVGQERAEREAKLEVLKKGTASNGSKSVSSPAKPVDKLTSTARAPTALSKPKQPTDKGFSQDLLFPGGRVAKTVSRGKMVVKTVTAEGHRIPCKAPLPTSASSSGQASSSGSPDRDRPQPRVASPGKQPAGSSAATSTKRSAAAMDATTSPTKPATSPTRSGGPGSPPGELPPRKKAKIDVFMTPKKRF